MTDSERLYNIIQINEKTGEKFTFPGYPVTHKEGCTMLSKFTKHSWRRLQLEEITNKGGVL